MARDGTAVAKAFIDAFNARDLDAFVATLDPGVEIHGNRGLRRGAEEARAWATRAPGGVQQTIEVSELHAEGDRVLALIVRRWHWDEEGHYGEEIGADAMAWLFELRDGKIASWRPYAHREAALAAFGGDEKA
jgi:limonene-1,2-epoxide hydrolase